jgi:hypothetical protein
VIVLDAGNGRMTSQPDDVVKAARSGRVDTLFLASKEHLWGTFNEVQDRVVMHSAPVMGDVGLLDYAALMTMRHGG